MPNLIAPETGYYTISSPISDQNLTLFCTSGQIIFYNDNDIVTCRPEDVSRTNYIVNTTSQNTTLPPLHSATSRVYHVDEEMPIESRISMDELPTLNSDLTTASISPDNFNYYGNTSIKADFSKSYEALDARVKEQEKTIQFLIDTLHDKGLFN